MFSKDQRITKNEDFQNIYKNGRYYFIDCFKIFILENSLKKTRFSVIASKKTLPLAIQRNSIKRKLRDFFHKNHAFLPKNTDILIIILNKKALSSTKEDFQKILLKINPKTK